MPAETVLILDDELIIRKTLQEFLTRKRHRVRTTETVEEAREVLFDSKTSFDLMFCDVNLPDGLGTDLLEEIQNMDNPPVVVMITGQGTIESAVRCMKLGAFDYLLKPFSHDEIDIILGKANKFQRLIQLNQGLSSETSSTGSRQLLGDSEPMERLQGLIQNVAQTDATVLITGETGTGKELISLAIHKANFSAMKRARLPVRCKAGLAALNWRMEGLCFLMKSVKSLSRSRRNSCGCFRNGNLSGWVGPKRSKSMFGYSRPPIVSCYKRWRMGPFARICITD